MFNINNIWEKNIIGLLEGMGENGRKIFREQVCNLRRICTLYTVERNTIW